jgi:hypothetical protein
LLSSKCALQGKEENKSCGKTLDPQIWFCPVLANDSFKEATELAKKRSKVSVRSKIRGFYGTEEG